MYRVLRDRIPPSPLEHLRLNTADTLVDLGCGTGIQQNKGVSRQESEVKFALYLAFELKRCTS
ncbi:MAG: hypothetical protein KME57_18705 [Scytonema hyalinum WJT4-NPBG1]|jgi:trans-aconitate methyltransferase|nr:hypothetical protein [Scytonema hyalinum WJT4-NPBG1]